MFHSKQLQKSMLVKISSGGTILHIKYQSFGTTKFFKHIIRLGLKLTVLSKEVKLNVRQLRLQE